MQPRKCGPRTLPKPRIHSGLAAAGLAGLAFAFVAGTGCRSLPWCGPPRLHTLAYIHRGDDILELQGIRRSLRPGSPLPAVTLTDQDFQPVPISSLLGRVLIISTVPSLDTPVCQKQTRRFYEAVQNLGGNVALVTISEDLPFAQKRFCAAEGIENSIVLSDFRGNPFARAAGLYVKQLGLLARAVIVVDPKGIVRYIRIVPDLTREPDYEAVMAAVREVMAASTAPAPGKNTPTAQDQPAPGTQPAP